MIDYNKLVGWVPINESKKFLERHFADGFLDMYMSGECVIDIGNGGRNYNAVLPHAISVDLDYPDYNGYDLPFSDGKVNTVYSSHCLEHISDYKRAIQDWYRVLAPHGFIIIVVPHMFLYEKKREPISRFNGDHKRFYTGASLLKEIEESLEPNSYRIRYLADNDYNYDYSLGPEVHADVKGHYDMEVVVQKINKPTWSIL